MSYKQKTSHLGIPVVGYGDRIVPEVELRKYQIIENMLIAGTRGVHNCVFDDGDFNIFAEADGTYTVTLSATGKRPSAEGLVGGAYFLAPTSLKWAGLARGYTYYLYLAGNPETFADPSQVRELSSKFSLEGANVLTATFDLTGENPKLNPEPDNKVYTEDMVAHANDSEDPHGSVLTQGTLVVKDRLVLPETIETLDGKTLTADGIIASANELTGKKVTVLKFDSAGRQGLTLTVPGVDSITFVYVQRSFAPHLLEEVTGDVVVGYFGQDPAVKQANEFSVYNWGDAGLPMQALVICK